MNPSVTQILQVIAFLHIFVESLKAHPSIIKT